MWVELGIISSDRFCGWPVLTLKIRIFRSEWKCWTSDFRFWSSLDAAYASYLENPIDPLERCVRDWLLTVSFGHFWSLPRFLALKILLIVKREWFEQWFCNYLWGCPGYLTWKSVGFSDRWVATSTQREHPSRAMDSGNGTNLSRVPTTPKTTKGRIVTSSLNRTEK